jgi:hypothetical protein
LLTPDWLKGRLAEAIKNVGPRYTPALNIDLAIARLFDGLSRTHSFYTRIEEAVSELRRKAQFLKRPTIPREFLKDVEDRYQRFLRATGLLAAVRTEPIDWPALREAAINCSDDAAKAIDSLRTDGQKALRKSPRQDPIKTPQVMRARLRNESGTSSTT